MCMLTGRRIQEHSPYFRRMLGVTVVTISFVRLRRLERDLVFALGNLGMLRCLCIWQLLFGVHVARGVLFQRLDSGYCSCVSLVGSLLSGVCVLPEEFFNGSTVDTVLASVHGGFGKNTQIS